MERFRRILADVQYDSLPDSLRMQIQELVDASPEGLFGKDVVFLIDFWQSEKSMGKRARKKVLKQAEEMILACASFASKTGSEATSGPRTKTIESQRPMHVRFLENAPTQTARFAQEILTQAKALGNLEKAMEAASKVEYANLRSNAYFEVAIEMGKAGMDAKPVFEKAMEAASKVEDRYNQSDVYSRIAIEMGRAALANKIFQFDFSFLKEMFGVAISSNNKILLEAIGANAPIGGIEAACCWFAFAGTGWSVAGDGRCQAQAARGV